MGDSGATTGQGIQPAAATLGAAVLMLAFNIIFFLAYQPSRKDIDDLQKEVSAIRSDPGPKPETKVVIESIEGKIRGIESRQDRLDERMNNMHLFIIQSMSPSFRQPLPMRKGEAPVFLPPQL